MVVTLEGIVEPTGNSVQARSSYLPNEILWGHRYQNMMSYNKKKGIYTVDCSNLNAVSQDETPRISAKQADEKRCLEAKRLAQLRRKISAISQTSLKSPAAKLSVFNARNMSRCQSTDDYGAGRWNEEGIAPSMTTSTLCDKSEMEGCGSLPTVTVVNVDKDRKNTITSNNIWVTNTSGQGAVLSNSNSLEEQNYGYEEDEFTQSPNGRLANVIGKKHKPSEKNDEIRPSNDGCGGNEGGVRIRMNENHVGVEIDQ